MDWKELSRETREAMDRVEERKDFVLGEDVRAFETEVAAYLGVRCAVGLNSGTDAFRIALAAIGLREGDEVATTPFCCVSDAAAVVMEGGTPVFADIDSRTCNIDIDRVAEKITEKTRAIIPVHMYGAPVDMDPLLDLAKERGIYIIEDACQAFGAALKGKKAGSFGDFAGYSFYPTKPLGCYGDAGLITTDSDEFAEKIRMIRNHGSRKRYYHEFIGFSSRLDTIQAAILRVRLKYVDQILNELSKIRKAYDERLQGVEGVIPPPVPPDATEGFSHYTIQTKKRDDLRDHLAQNGVKADVCYPLSIHLQEAFRFLGHRPGDFPESEKAQAR
ncbi:MAG: DegT/DnrJ/EryC1/StrS family aminotransferase, partial [Desulfobacterales bacterium]|nr:DegT/DnrJ/EryC1/StrS family aminotransferase [Desulfobacterales bacterium]